MSEAQGPEQDIKAALDGAPAPSATETGFTNDDLPLFFRKDIIPVVEQFANKIDPDHVYRWVKVKNTTATNMANKRLKGFSPLKDKTLVQRIANILGDGSTELVENGHIVYNELELWRVPIRQALAMRHYNSQRAHGQPGDVTKSLESQFAEAADRSQGRINVELTGPDVFDRSPKTNISRKGSR